MRADTKTLHERIWGRVAVVLSGDDCWLWMGTVNAHGYGVIGVGGRAGRNYLVHRLVYELLHGPVPQGVGVLHHCDTPACVRPSHLWQGSQADNMADMDAKGRGRRHFAGRRQLTAQQVGAILASPESSRLLARRYPITDGGIRALRRRGGYRQPR